MLVAQNQYFIIYFFTAATEGTRNSPILLDVDDNYPPVPEFEKRIEIPKTMMQEYDKKNAQKGIRHNPSLPFDKVWEHVPHCKRFFNTKSFG